MFNWLFGEKRQKRLPTAFQFPFGAGASDSDFVAPTDKQKSYARKLKIAYTAKTSREELSALISEAEAANPKLGQERVRAKERQREQKFGADLVAAERQWEELSNQNKWLVAVYKSGKSIKAEMLRLNGAFIEDNGKLKIESEVGKIVKDRDIGYCVDLGRYFELDVSKLLWSQVVDNFDIDEVERFTRMLNHAELVAAQIARQSNG